MIRAPARRIWLYPVDGALEILLFGEEAEIAPLFAALRRLCEGWPGFERVEAIAQGTAQLGMRVTRAPICTRSLIREAVRALHESMPVLFARIAWSGDDTGIVGTW